MRKLAWFTGGFAGMCLAGCYVPELLFPILAVLAVLIPAALGLRLAARTGRFHAASLAAAARRALALGLGGVAAAGWFLGWSALLRAPADALAGQERTLSGTVSSYPAETSIGGFSLTVALDGGLTAPDILVYGTQEWGGLVPGDRVTFEARLKASDLMYGDETTYYTAKGIFLTASCGEAPILAERPVQLSPRWWPAHCARALRDSLLAAYDSTAAPLAVALVTGDKSFLSDALDTYLSRSGTSHAMVVSGLHVSCLVAFAVALTRGRRRLALLIVPFLLFYALMAGGTPSAFRAVMMQGVFLAAPIARRETDGLTSLSAALLVLLLLNPYAAGSVSLQLSFTSVAGILAVAPALSAKWLRAVKALAGRGQFWALAARPLRTAALSMATSLGAMAFTQPVLALYFRQTSLIFPLTNLLVLWAVALFLVCALPVGLLGVFLPVLARPLGMLTGLLAHYIVAVVSTLGRWRFAAVDTGQFPYLLCLAGVYLFLAAALLLRKQRLRLIVPLGCAGLLLAGALALTRLPALAPGSRSRRWMWGKAHPPPCCPAGTPVWWTAAGTGRTTPETWRPTTSPPWDSSTWTCWCSPILMRTMSMECPSCWSACRWTRWPSLGRTPPPDGWNCCCPVSRQRGRSLSMWRRSPGWSWVLPPSRSTRPWAAEPPTRRVCSPFAPMGILTPSSPGMQTLLWRKCWSNTTTCPIWSCWSQAITVPPVLPRRSCWMRCGPSWFSSPVATTATATPLPKPWSG